MLHAHGLSVANSCIVRCHVTANKSMNASLKPATHLAILYADRRDRRESPGVSVAAIAIFADRRDRRIKSLISGTSDIGD